MTCKDCNGTGKYQPLTGPPKPCRKCQDAPDLSLARVGLLALRPDHVSNADLVSDFVKIFIREGFNSFHPIKVKKEGSMYLVIDGNARIAALRRLYKYAPKSLDRVLQYEQVPVKIEYIG